MPGWRRTGNIPMKSLNQIWMTNYSNMQNRHGESEYINRQIWIHIRYINPAIFHICHKTATSFTSYGWRDFLWLVSHRNLTT